MMQAPPLRYTELSPSAAASRVALSYWMFDVHALPEPDFTHRVWPDGCASLVLVIAGGHVVAARVQGSSLEPLNVPVEVGCSYRGVRFRPEAGALWCGLPAHELINANLDARDLFGASLDPVIAGASNADDEAFAALLDGWISTRVESAPALAAVDELVRDAVDRLLMGDTRVSLADVTESLGCSPRTLQRRFLASVGYSPKVFARVRRIRALLQRTVEDGMPGKLSWSGLAAEGGYADQAHLTREIGKLTRLSPTRLEVRLRAIEHRRLLA